jgi:hypothetical protein
MLHPINPAAEVELRNVLAFQRRVLEFALLPGLTIPLVRQEVNVHFGANAPWFWRHRSLRAPVVALNALVRADQPLAAQILAAFDNDLEFDQHTNDPAFAFACFALPEPPRENVRALLETFYDILGSKGGFSSQLTGNGPLTRNTLVAEFWLGNPDLKVCPACDGPPPERTGDKIHAQCDHHFPVSKHPALSIHPRNLVPICTPCNEDINGDLDANDRAHLSQMFLPYAREVFGPLRKQAVRDPRQGLAVLFDDGGAANTPRIQSLNYILRLQERWTARLQDQVAPKIENTLRHQWHLIDRLGSGPADLLQDIATQLQESRGARGRSPNALIEETYWTLLANDPNARAAILQ